MLEDGGKWHIISAYPWYFKHSEHSQTDFFCCQHCCQLCCQLGNDVGNNVGNKSHVISPTSSKNTYDHTLVGVREGDAHINLLPRWRDVVVSCSSPQSGFWTKYVQKAAFPRVTTPSLEVNISELSGSWAINKVSNTLIQTVPRISN